MHHIKDAIPFSGGGQKLISSESKRWSFYFSEMFPSTSRSIFISVAEIYP